MAISQDGSTPALTSGFGNAGTVTTLQSPGFSPPAGSLIVVLVAFDYLATNAGSPVFAVTDSKGGTYTPGPGVYDTEYNRAQIWYRYVTTAPGSMTVMVTNTGPEAEHGWIIIPYVLDGASPDQAGAASAAAFSTSTSQVPWTGTITTTSPGSWVLTVVAGGNTETITPLTGTTTLSDTTDATEGATYLTGRNATPVVIPGAVSIGWTPATGAIAYDYAWAALEILAASLPLGLPPLSVKRSPYRRAVVGRGSCGGGVAVPPAVPSRGPVMPPMTWMGGAGHRPMPARARLGNNLAAGDGITGPAPAAAAAVLPRSRPFVARNHAPARAVCGPRSAPSGGIASQVVTPLGYPSQPAARPVIVHLPPHRAKVGPGTYLASGRPGVQTPLGFQAQPQPRPVIVHVPPARARLGLRGQAAGGVLSAVSTPLGSPSQPAPRPVIQHLPPRRAVWRGLATQNFPAGVAPYRPRPFVFRFPLPARARLGNNLQAGDGYASGVVTPLGTPVPPRPFVFRSPAPARTRLGPRGQAAGGIASSIVTPLGSLGPPRPFVFRSPASARARLGNNLQSGDGFASPVVTPLGSPPRRELGWIFRSPAPARGKLGSRGQTASGYDSSIVTPLGVPSRPELGWIFRSPAPARARLGNRSLPAAGTVSSTVTPLAAVLPLCPPVFRRPARVRALWRGLAVPLATGTAYQRPPVQVRRAAPVRALWRGFASPVVTPLGPLPAPRKVPVFPPKITRARIGPAGAVAGGIASKVVTPPFVTFTTAYQRPAPYIKRPAPAHAVLGHGGIAGGVASPVVTPLGSPAQPLPRPVLQHLPSHRVVWHGEAVPAAVTATIYQRKPFIFRAPPPARARAGSRGTIAGGVASAVITPLGTVGPPHPFVARKGGFRAVAGHSRVAAGIASSIVTPLGAVTPPRPPVFRRPAPNRALWRGLAATPVPGTAYQRPPVQVRRPSRARAIWHGYASPVITPLGSLGPPRPFVARSPLPPRARGLWRGYASSVVTPPFVSFLTAYQRPAPQVKRPAPARAVAGPRGSLAAGRTGIQTPLGYPSQPPARPVIQHLPPHRAVWHGAAGTGPAVTAYQRRPFVFRAPAPARGRVGTRASIAGGIAAVAAPSTASRPEPFVFRSPAPARGRLGNSLRSAAGIASRVVTPLGTIGPPKPFVFRSPPRARGRLGAHATASGGVASPVITPLGTVGPPRPFVARKGPRRALAGHSTVAGGIASTSIAPLGSLPPRRKVPQFPPKITRATVGHGTVSGGIASTVVTPLGSIGPPRPFVARSPLPVRARGLWRGFASAVVTPPIITPPLFATPAAQWKWTAGGAQWKWGTCGDQRKLGTAGGARNQ